MPNYIDTAVIAAEATYFGVRYYGPDDLIIEREGNLPFALRQTAVILERPVLPARLPHADVSVIAYSDTGKTTLFTFTRPVREATVPA